MNAGEREGLRRLLERLDLDHAQFAGRGSLFGDAADALRGLLDALEAAEAAVRFKQGLLTDVARDCGRAERKIAAVEALADEYATAIEPDGSTSMAPVRWVAADLRAALAVEITAEGAS